MTGADEGLAPLLLLPVQLWWNARTGGVFPGTLWTGLRVLLVSDGIWSASLLGAVGWSVEDSGSGSSSLMR